MNVITTPNSVECDGFSISLAGIGALLIDVARSDFCAQTQKRFWALAAALRYDCALPIRELVPGVNNLLVVFNPLQLTTQQLQDKVLGLWAQAGEADIASREVEIPMIYGGAAGEDLLMLADAAGLAVEQWVACHSAVTYQVACVGSMPGFAYLSGLPTRLALARRSAPRTRIEKGAVIIGGSQAGVMPCASPSGWHLVGHSDLDLFDPHRADPCLLMPGDRVRFVSQGIAL